MNYIDELIVNVLYYIIYTKYYRETHSINKMEKIGIYVVVDFVNIS